MCARCGTQSSNPCPLSGRNKAPNEGPATDTVSRALPVFCAGAESIHNFQPNPTPRPPNLPQSGDQYEADQPRRPRHVLTRLHPRTAGQRPHPGPGPGHPRPAPIRHVSGRQNRLADHQQQRPEIPGSPRHPALPPPTTPTTPSPKSWTRPGKASPAGKPPSARNESRRTRHQSSGSRSRNVRGSIAEELEHLRRAIAVEPADPAWNR